MAYPPVAISPMWARYRWRDGYVAQGLEVSSMLAGLRAFREVVVEACRKPKATFRIELPDPTESTHSWPGIGRWYFIHSMMVRAMPEQDRGWSFYGVIDPAAHGVVSLYVTTDTCLRLADVIDAGKRGSYEVGFDPHFQGAHMKRRESELRSHVQFVWWGMRPDPDR